MREKQFGYVRSVCACYECVLNCRFLPGYLVPDDLPRIAAVRQRADQTLFEWAETELLASPGATVMLHDGTITTVPSLVPATHEKGHWCRFLNRDERCSIHEVAPFGCAFYDAHESHESANEKTMNGLLAIIEDHQSNGLYSQVWRHLHAKDLRAENASTKRARMRAAMTLEMKIK